MSKNIPEATQSSAVKWIVEMYPLNPLGKIDPGVPDDNLKVPSIGIAAPSGLRESFSKISQAIGGNIESKEGQGAQLNRTFGLRTVSISRNKAQPDADCTFTITGKLQPEMCAGSWAIVSSVEAGSTEASVGVSNIVIRFIGQIERVSVNYSADSTGNLVQENTILLREWSTILLSAYKFTQQSIVAAAGKNAKSEAGNVAAAALSTVAGRETAGGGNDIVKLYNEILEDSFDPFETVHLILRLYSLISDADALQRAQKAPKNFHTFALSPPKVPKLLLDRLAITQQQTGTNVIGGAIEAFDALNNAVAGLFGETSGGDNAFNSGFVKVVTGTQTTIVDDPVNRYGARNGNNWNGVFGNGDGPTINEYAASVKKHYEENYKKFRLPGALRGFASGQLIGWQAILEGMESAVMEVYTDMWHEYVNRKDKNGGIKAQPVIVVRLKPYLLDQVFNDNSAESQTNADGIMAAASLDFSSPNISKSDVRKAIEPVYTRFEDLPCIKMPNESILSFNVQNSFLTSPNYITTDLALPGNNANIAFLQGITGATLRMTGEMDRFGGQEMNIRMRFIGNDTNEGKESKTEAPIPGVTGVVASAADNFAGGGGKSKSENSGAGAPSANLKYFAEVAEINKYWYSFLYRMGSGTIQIIDDNSALSVGFNLEFKIGDRILVGHIDGFSTEFQVQGDGIESTVTTIQLSRIVFKEGDNLRLPEMNEFGRILDRFVER